MRTVARQFGSSSAVNRMPMEDWELIWENEDPSVAFAAQTLSLNLARFGWIKVEAILATGENDYAVTMDAPVGTEDEHQDAMIQMMNRMTTAIAAGEMYGYSRCFYATEIGVTFQACSRRRLNTTSDAANSTQNARVVPTRIWGKATASSVGGDASFHDSGFGFRKLWVNPAPTEEFAGQTVSLDLSEYDAVYIDYGYTNGQIYGTHIVLKGYTAHIRYVGNSSNNIQMNTRSATVSDTGVVFSAASTRTQGSAGTASTANTRLIPVHIYGIKFG